jgi:hypothetical protein
VFALDGQFLVTAIRPTFRHRGRAIEPNAPDSLIFEDDLYAKIFDGRPAIDYLTFYRLLRIASDTGRGHTRTGYTKWLVMHFVWSEVGTELRRHSLQASSKILLQSALGRDARITSKWQALFFRNHGQENVGRVPGVVIDRLLSRSEMGLGFVAASGIQVALKQRKRR